MTKVHFKITALFIMTALMSLGMLLAVPPTYTSAQENMTDTEQNMTDTEQNMTDTEQNMTESIMGTIAGAAKGSS